MKNCLKGKTNLTLSFFKKLTSPCRTRLLYPLCLLSLLLNLANSAHAFTLNDDTGRKITLSAPAQRIVSLAPSITENLFAIGAGSHIVGTASFSNFPPAAKNITIISDYQNIDLERLATLKPDVVIAWQGGNSPAQIAALERLNIPIFFHQIRTLADIPTSLMRLAQLTGMESNAAPIILKAYQDLPLLRDADKPSLPTFYQVWNTPLMTLGGSSWVSDVLARCGASNIFKNLPLAAPTVNIEDVLKLNPVIIATATPSAHADASLNSWKKWTTLPAVQKNGFIFTEADTMNRATLRTIVTAKKMCSDIALVRQRL